MISIQILQDADKPLFRSFVGEMINDWLDQSSMQADAACCPDRTIGGVLERYERAVDGKSWLIVAKDELSQAVVGSLVVERGHRWLRYAEGHLLNIHPDYRRAGCGHLLMGHAMHVLRLQRIKKLVLKTWDGNQPALAAFARAGAVATGGEPGGHSVTTVSWLPMVLSTLDNPYVDQNVKAGNFYAEAALDAGIVRIGLNVGERRRDFAVIPS